MLVSVHPTDLDSNIRDGRIHIRQTSFLSDVNAPPSKLGWITLCISDVCIATGLCQMLSVTNCKAEQSLFSEVTDEKLTSHDDDDQRRLNKPAPHGQKAVSRVRL